MDFWRFFISENLFFWFSSTKKSSCNADIEIPYCKKFPLSTKTTDFLKLNFQLIKKIIYVDKNNKRFGQQNRVSVFNGPPQNAIEHPKTFFGPVFDYFLSMYMKNVFCFISQFSLKIFCLFCQ